MSSVPPAFAAYGEEELEQAPAFGPGKSGEFEATLVREKGGETRLLREYTRVPYHLTGTLDVDPADGLTTLCLQEPTGGVAQGDRHSIDVTARERARAHVTTQSATKVHSMQANYAHLDATLTAEPGSHLEYLPGPTIVNENARCLQTVSVDFSEDAVVVVGDVLVPNGLSNHEPFAFDHYASHIEARHDGELVCVDAVDLQPATGVPADAATMGKYGVVGSLYIFAPTVEISPLTDAIHDRLETDGDTMTGVSELADGVGVAVRVLGNRMTDVSDAVTAAWDETRSATLAVGAPEDRWY
ncbi:MULTISPECIES: urease accessory protein UreD [Salinibaculum]|uniref:urease accessory protein UreD n=1 Tax=Salinibaculum TaxID=2732368 RepID=UPI0030D1E764